ncbi:MAG: transcriptional regulator [Salaquimonas sp.]|nr:transcriptional regulator [Salaquimonas sp.]
MSAGFGLALLVSGAGLPQPAKALELIMIEQAGCMWCARWDKEIGVAYDKTTEGKVAPLRRVDLHAPWPEDLGAIKPERLTPTFVLADNGQEIGRLRGYPGDEFFWVLLDELLEKRPGKATASKVTD